MPQEGNYTPAGPSIEEACLHVAEKLRGASRFLLEIRPESVERCQAELEQVIAVLENLVSHGDFQYNPRVSSMLAGIRRSACALGLQIKYASNLYSGWLQLRLGAGYTQQGLPVFVTAKTGASFEA
jgi:hypothetical protein